MLIYRKQLPSRFECPGNWLTVSSISPRSPIGDIPYSMTRATVTIPDDLAKAVDSYVQAQEAPPPLTAVVQAALREYLAERGFFAGFRSAAADHSSSSGQWAA